ncbi:hypothetical protein [Furfurilactobacillus siliginis]|uniref:Glycosyltransferase n=1 Tax=Furfurilactobacillus siliginis TaxID=348151 RepID=A0A0R2KV75_9LACO|nr:hypothetical protein [Furfurilactobacillus siliginis]KRN93353.1 glycosyltransferase [Furfurilactobacillus siliginis]GEK29538.1 hypothetical protein LSI01_18490 [Furfurilactobacillus siliginis]
MTVWISNFHYQTDGVATMNKARLDVLEFGGTLGALPMNFFPYVWPDEPDDILSARQDGMLAGFKPNDVFVLQFPLFIRGLNVIRFIEKVHAMGGKVIGYIHDYAPLAEPAEFNDDHFDPLKEIYSRRTPDLILPLFDVIVVHTTAMAEALQKRTDKQLNYVVQGPFSYRVPMELTPREHSLSDPLCLASSLGKATWVLDSGMEFNIYGQKTPKYEEALANHPELHFKGLVPAVALPSQAEGSFGVVWDTGEYQEYERVNFPHKVSAYLAAGMPLIIWSGAAAAEFVLRNDVGIVIDDISELKASVEAVTEDRYQTLVSNAQHMGRYITSGALTQQALLSALQKIEQIDLAGL